MARRHGINLPRQTLARWVELAAQWLTPVYQQIKTGVMAGGYVQLDETPIDYLEPGAGRTLKGYLWTGSRPGGDVFFDWHPSRAGACLDTVVPVDFQGTVQCDGYDGYNRLARVRARRSSWPIAGRMCAASSTTPWKALAGLRGG